VGQGVALGPRGSRNWQLRCTGPGRGPRQWRAAASMVVSTVRAGVLESGGGTSAAHLVYPPNSFTYKAHQGLGLEGSGGVRGGEGRGGGGKPAVSGHLKILEARKEESNGCVQVRVH